MLCAVLRPPARATGRDGPSLGPVVGVVRFRAVGGPAELVARGPAHAAAGQADVSGSGGAKGYVQRRGHPTFTAARLPRLVASHSLLRLLQDGLASDLWEGVGGSDMV